MFMVPRLATFAHYPCRSHCCLVAVRQDCVVRSLFLSLHAWLERKGLCNFQISVLPGLMTGIYAKPKCSKQQKHKGSVSALPCIFPGKILIMSTNPVHFSWSVVLWKCHFNVRIFCKSVTWKKKWYQGEWVERICHNGWSGSLLLKWMTTQTCCWCPRWARGGGT